jgi:hypothetical protein
MWPAVRFVLLLNLGGLGLVQADGDRNGVSVEVGEVAPPPCRHRVFETGRDARYARSEVGELRMSVRAFLRQENLPSCDTS